MLTIRRHQLTAFRRRLLDAFVEDALAAVARHWPQVYRATEEGALRTRIRRNVRRALDVGLTTEGELLRYLNVALALGDDFLEQVPAAGTVLTDLRTPPEKLEEWVRLATRELRRRGP
jgi:hypothetical protein